MSHGTLGIAYALAAVGTAVGRPDLVDAALAGVADVVARDEAGPEGFLVPHSDPQQVAFGLERYSYGWCHGPAGDAQVFRLLAQLADGRPEVTYQFSAQSSQASVCAEVQSRGASTSTAAEGRSISRWASAILVPGRMPMRHSTSHQAGTDDGQSPPTILPGLKFSGCG